MWSLEAYPNLVERARKDITLIKVIFSENIIVNFILFP
jgi:hypothetical protein